jgi:hypothetical protein
VTPRTACSHRQGARSAPPRWRSSLRTSDRSSPRESYRQRRGNASTLAKTALLGRSPWRPVRPLPASRRS